VTFAHASFVKDPDVCDAESHLFQRSEIRHAANCGAKCRLSVRYEIDVRVYRIQGWLEPLVTRLPDDIIKKSLGHFNAQEQSGVGGEGSYDRREEPAVQAPDSSLASDLQKFGDVASNNFGIVPRLHLQRDQARGRSSL
jgi:hypothetical protein